MQTFIHTLLADTEEGREADCILRRCVHCGFCNATCPTFQLLGDERDSPRGRIYLIKEMLENNTATRETQLHLDRCLTCRACETTCPSGVEYNRLLEIGRSLAERHAQRPTSERLQRIALLETVPNPARMRPLLKLGRAARAFLPAQIRRSLPRTAARKASWPTASHSRHVLLLEGCVQSVTHPQINAAAARLLDRLGVRAVPAAGCCGALAHHLTAEQRTRDTARRNIDAWWADVESGAEAVLLSASGCAPTVQEYGRLLKDDPSYAEKAARLSALAMDISEFVENEDTEKMRPKTTPQSPIAFHAPCSLQHGLRRSGRVERLLTSLGFELIPIADAHLCCGSAGSYSILQRELSERLLNEKVRHLEAGSPQVIATANIGCLAHLESGTDIPVRHWVELLA
ncbi:MAG: glycolate oxidase subunit GlcF [Xanthomonadales bacterium]|nr:glycolate oxidase subunit GlcF [Gammaproteobacteria bacterium]NNL05069.1 glycolate oxidase subunit GlcF [Xanthomonadales bacterium]